MSNEKKLEELKKLKQEFERLYEENIEAINPEEIIGKCKEYLYRGKEENSMYCLNDFIKKTSRVSGSGSQYLDLRGIIGLLEKMIQFLERE